MTPEVEIKEVAGWLRLFVEPSQATELRAIRCNIAGRTSTQAGFYDGKHLETMARDALRLTKVAEGVYFIPNPIDPALLERCSYKAQTAGEKQLTSDDDITRRRWFVVDADPIRGVKGCVSSSDEEKSHAWQAIEKAREKLTAQAIFGRLVLADSGNGYHLACQVDINVNDLGLIRATLIGLSKELDTPRVKIDRLLFNPSRIIKLYGTWARKGKSTTERPHRRSCVLKVYDL